MPEWEFVDKPELKNPAMERARDAVASSRAAKSDRDRREANRADQQRQTLTYQGTRNGIVYLKAPGGQPFPSRAKPVTNGAIAVGTEVQITASGQVVAVNQTPRVQVTPTPTTKEVKGDIKYLYSLIQGGERRYYVGGFQKRSIEVSQMAGLDIPDRIGIDNKGGRAWSIDWQLDYGSFSPTQSVLSNGTTYTASATGLFASCNPGFSWWQGYPSSGEDLQTYYYYKGERSTYPYSLSGIIAPEQDYALSFQRKLLPSGLLSPVGTYTVSASGAGEATRYDVVASAICFVDRINKTGSAGIGWVENWTASDSPTSGGILPQNRSLYLTLTNSPRRPVFYGNAIGEVQADKDFTNFENYWLDVQKATFTGILRADTAAILTQDLTLNVHYFNQKFEETRTKQVKTYKADQIGTSLQLHGVSYAESST